MEGEDGREGTWAVFEMVSFNREEKNGVVASIESYARAKGETISCCLSEGEGNGTSLGESMEACLLEKDGKRGIVGGLETRSVDSFCKDS